METKGKSKAEKDSLNMADKQEGLSKEDNSQKELDNLFVDSEKDLHAVFKVGSVEGVDQSGASTVCDSEHKSTSVRADDDVTAQGHVGGLCSLDAASSQSRDQSHDRMENEATAATATDNIANNTQQPAENISDNTTTTGNQTDKTATTVVRHTEHGDVTHFQQDAESETTNPNAQQAKSGDDPATSSATASSSQAITIPLSDSHRSSSGNGVDKGAPPTPPNTPGYPRPHPGLPQLYRVPDLVELDESGELLERLVRAQHRDAGQRRRLRRDVPWITR